MFTGDFNKVVFLSIDIMYQVIFKTGEQPNAGTDANVYFQLVGDKGQTERIELREDRNLRLFEAGGSDKFRIETQDVGKVSCTAVQLPFCNDDKTVGYLFLFFWP